MNKEASIVIGLAIAFCAIIFSQSVEGMLFGLGIGFTLAAMA